MDDEIFLVVVFVFYPLFFEITIKYFVVARNQSKNNETFKEIFKNNFFPQSFSYRCFRSKTFQNSCRIPNFVTFLEGQCTKYRCLRSILRQLR